MNVKNKAMNIKLLVMDVDGTLTDGKINMGPDGELFKAFDIKDGYAMQHAVKCGLRLAIISGAKTESTRVRYENLGLKDIILGASVKILAYNQLCEKYGLKDEEVVFMGDDIPDYEVMSRCGLPCCPADAASEIKQVSKYVSHRNGGDGCARDVLEQILKAQGLWMHNAEAFGW